MLDQAACPLTWEELLRMAAEIMRPGLGEPYAPGAIATNDQAVAQWADYMREGHGLDFGDEAIRKAFVAGAVTILETTKRNVPTHGREWAVPAALGLILVLTRFDEEVRKRALS